MSVVENAGKVAKDVADRIREAANRIIEDSNHPHSVSFVVHVGVPYAVVPEGEVSETTEWAMHTTKNCHTAEAVFLTSSAQRTMRRRMAS